MKKRIITVIVATLFSVFTYAQAGFNLWASIGFPYENYEGYEFSFAFSVDANYLFEVNQAFDIGLATGYGQAFGDSYYVGPIYGNFDTPDFQYVPAAAALRFNVNRNFVFGADIGYAFSVTSAKDNFNDKYYDGGFYWRPMFGFNLNKNFNWTLIILELAIITFITQHLT